MKQIITIDVWEADEITDETYQHVFDSISQGYREGEINQSTEDDTASGYWSIKTVEETK